MTTHRHTHARADAMTNTHRPNQPQRRRSVQASPPQAVATVQQPCSIGTLLGGDLWWGRGKECRGVCACACMCIHVAPSSKNVRPMRSNPSGVTYNNITIHIYIHYTHMRLHRQSAMHHHTSCSSSTNPQHCKCFLMHACAAQLNSPPPYTCAVAGSRCPASAAQSPIARRSAAPTTRRKGSTTSLAPAGRDLALSAACRGRSATRERVSGRAALPAAAVKAGRQQQQQQQQQEKVGGGSGAWAGSMQGCKVYTCVDAYTCVPLPMSAAPPPVTSSFPLATAPGTLPDPRAPVDHTHSPYCSVVPGRPSL
jgi:hypothetical protein